MPPSELIPASRLFRFACHEDVTRMPARPVGHHCESCRKTVVDMSRLTPEEAVETVRTAPSSTCVSYAFAEDGSLLFRSGRRVGGTVAIALSAFLAACNPAEPPSPPREPEVSPLQQVAEEATAVPPALEPTSAPDYHSSGGQVWPSASETTVATPPPPPPRPPVEKNPPPPIRRTAGKPVQHLAGGLAVVGEREL